MAKQQLTFEVWIVFKMKYSNFTTEIKVAEHSPTTLTISFYILNSL